MTGETEFKQKPFRVLSEERNIPDRHFDDWLTGYVNYTSNQEATEKIHKWVGISVLAAALERRTWMDRGHYILYPNLYIFVIGPSGVVRKSTSTAIGVNMLREMDDLRIMSERVTAASLIQQLKASGKVFEHDGKQERQSAVFCYASELNVFLNEVFGSISELLTTFYDCVPHDSSKPWIYETKGEGAQKIYGPCLNILGASTPRWLERAIPQSEMEGGFASRVIFVVETQAPKNFIAWPDVFDEDRANRVKLVRDLKRISELTGPFKVTPEARQWFTRTYIEHQKELLTLQDARFAGYYGRKPDTILKLSMVFSVSESDSLEIKVSHMERAQLWLNELELNMFSSFHQEGKNEYAAEMIKIVSALQEHKTLSHAGLLRIHGRDVSHQQLMKIMEHLINAEVAQIKRVGNKVFYEYRKEPEATSVSAPSVALHVSPVPSQ